MTGAATPHDDHLARAGGEGAREIERAREEDRIVHLVAAISAARIDARSEGAAAHADWLAGEARLAASAAERQRDGRHARDFAARVLARRGLERALHDGLVTRIGRPPAERGAPRALPAAAAVDAAATHGCAPLVELRVAAGAGRELWEQPCDRWVELPADLPRGRYVALGVWGDSMEPLIAAGDTVLVRLGARPAPGAVVVARLPDDGYVVKQVGRTTARTIELRSLNAAYPPIRVGRALQTVLGAVVMAWSARDA